MATATPQHTASLPGAKAAHEEFQQRTVFERFTSALRRRTNHWAARLQGPARYDHAERSLHWLLNHGEQILAEIGRCVSSTSLNTQAGATAGLPSSALCSEPRDQLVLRAISVLNSYGQLAYAEAWSERLRPSAAELRIDTSDPASQALHAYHQGDRATGDALMHQLRRRQHADGSFELDDSTTAVKLTQQLSTVLAFLEAAQLQVALTFASGADPVYADIDPSDPRAEAASQWFATLDRSAKVADIGCGSGRFLRLFAQFGHSHNLIGIDPALDCSDEQLPRVEHRTGGLLHLPAADAEFDAAFAIESLEHALVPQTAIAELCRVVRPGGQILVIDKNAQLQPLSNHAPWERWFHPEEVCRWLWRHCDNVRVAPVLSPTHATNKPTFLAWYGQRKSERT